MSRAFFAFSISFIILQLDFHGAVFRPGTILLTPYIMRIGPEKFMTVSRVAS